MLSLTSHPAPAGSGGTLSSCRKIAQNASLTFTAQADLSNVKEPQMRKNNRLQEKDKLSALLLKRPLFGKKKIGKITLNNSVWFRRILQLFVQT